MFSCRTVAIREPPYIGGVLKESDSKHYPTDSRKRVRFLRAGVQFMSRPTAMSSRPLKYTNMFMFDRSHRNIAFSPRFHSLGIDWISRHLPGEDADDFLGRLGLQFHQRLHRIEAHMRRQDYVVAADQRRGRRRLLRQDIKSRPGELSRVECVRQSWFVHDGAACGVNQVSGWFHLP